MAGEFEYDCPRSSRLGAGDSLHLGVRVGCPIIRKWRCVGNRQFWGVLRSEAPLWDVTHRSHRL